MNYSLTSNKSTCNWYSAMQQKCTLLLPSQFCCNQDCCCFEKGISGMKWYLNPKKNSPQFCQLAIDTLQCNRNGLAFFISKMVPTQTNVVVLLSVRKWLINNPKWFFYSPQFCQLAIDILQCNRNGFASFQANLVVLKTVFVIWFDQRVVREWSIDVSTLNR